MNPHLPTPHPDRWRVILAALVAVLALLVGAAAASAATVPVAQTRVGAFTPAVVTTVGVHRSISAGQRWGHAPPQAETVVATGVAAKLVDKLASVGFRSDTSHIFRIAPRGE